VTTSSAAAILAKAVDLKVFVEMKNACRGWVTSKAMLFQQFIFIYIFWCCGPMRVMASSFMRFLDHTLWCTTIGRTPGWVISSSQRPLPNNTHKRQTDASGRIWTHGLSRRAATDQCLRLHSHWDQLLQQLLSVKQFKSARRTWPCCFIDDFEIHAAWYLYLSVYLLITNHMYCSRNAPSSRPLDMAKACSQEMHYNFLCPSFTEIGHIDRKSVV
jgi:hypothetical protein